MDYIDKLHGLYLYPFHSKTTKHRVRRKQSNIEQPRFSTLNSNGERTKISRLGRKESRLRNSSTTMNSPKSEANENASLAQRWINNTMVGLKSGQEKMERIEQKTTSSWEGRRENGKRKLNKWLRVFGMKLEKRKEGAIASLHLCNFSSKHFHVSDF